jgi:hypothetical protein
MLLVFFRMESYTPQTWLAVYQAAMVETIPSLIAGRLLVARAEIIKRLDHLRGTPGSHTQERQAIEDAVNGLKILEREAEHRRSDPKVAT